jgi:hypothetical protein
MATTWTMATAKRVTGVQRRQQGGWCKGHGPLCYDWREGDDGGDGDGDGARDMAACTTTGERGIMVAMGHGFCVCFCVSGETTKNKEESKIVNVC